MLQAVSPAGAQDMRAVTVHDVTRTFIARDRTVQALEGMSLHANAGEIVAVVGPSGCGKTTLLELICGLQRPDQGRCEALPAALMPQRDLLLPWRSALDNARSRCACRPVAAAGPGPGGALV